MWLVLCLVLLSWGARSVTAAPVSITTATDLQASITANPVGTVFLLQAGTHRRGSLVPKDGNVFIGAAGAILSGGEILTGWTASGSDWFVTGQTQQGEVLNAVQCTTAGYAQCANPEDVFYDGVPLIGVANQAALGPGKFFFDYVADRIYIRDTPSGHTVATSVRANAFTGLAQNVTLRNLTIEQYATPTQKAAIEPSAGSHGWTIDNCVIRHNHSRGVTITGSRWTLRGNTVSTNGHVGIAGGGKNILIEGNVISDNNYARYNVEWEAAGLKVVAVRGLRVLRNQAHNNYGPGLWCDINCVDVLYAHNVVTNNTREGLFHEISYHAVIRHNTAEHNGLVPVGWNILGGQIFVSSSERTAVYGNVARVSPTGGSSLMMLQQNRGSGLWGTYKLQWNTVRHNTLRYAPGTTFNSGYTGAWQDFGDLSVQHNVWDYNITFVNPSLNRFLWHPCSPDVNPYANFVACGQDVHGVRYDP